MTVLSQVNAEQFCSHVKFILPEGVFFSPSDYLDTFNDGRRAAGMPPLGETTFRKYLGLVCDTPYFPGLSRARNDSKSSYFYFVDTSAQGTKPRVSPKKRRSFVKDALLVLPQRSPRTSPLSKTSLSKFMRRVIPLMNPGYNRVDSVRLRYNRQKSYHPLKKTTFAYYFSLVYREDLWEGLTRQRGKKKAFEYCCEPLKERAVPTPRKSDSRGVAVGREANSFRSWRAVQEAEGDVVEAVEAIAGECVYCRASNPSHAKFCMECGGSLASRIKTVLQERVVSLFFPKHTSHTGLNGMSQPQIEDAVKGWVINNLKVSMETGEGGPTVIVDVKGGSRG